MYNCQFRVKLMHECVCGVNFRKPLSREFFLYCINQRKCVKLIDNNLGYVINLHCN